MTSPSVTRCRAEKELRDLGEGRPCWSLARLGKEAEGMWGRGRCTVVLGWAVVTWALVQTPVLMQLFSYLA